MTGNKVSATYHIYMTIIRTTRGYTRIVIRTTRGYTRIVILFPIQFQ